MLASMRLCANVPAQYGIQTALGGYQSINDLVAPGGRLVRQRDLAWDLLTRIPGITCFKTSCSNVFISSFRSKNISNQG